MKNYERAALITLIVVMLDIIIIDGCLQLIRKPVTLFVNLGILALTIAAILNYFIFKFLITKLKNK